MKYLVFLPIALSFAPSAAPVPPGIPDLHAESVPDFTRPHDACTSLAEYEGGNALQIEFGTEATWPNLSFVAPEGGWDWAAFAGIQIGFFNPGTDEITINLRVDNAGANGMDHCNTKQKLVPPGGTAELTLIFSTTDRVRFWGMRGIPIRGPMGTGAPLDLTHITGWQVFLDQPAQRETLLVTSVALVGEGGDLGQKVPFPFIDAFGQYTGIDWPGKIHHEEELQATYEKEIAARTEAPRTDLDTFGGWAGGPQLEATGRFRTAQVDGKWWLVSPEGHLFFSAGVDCVGTWSQTFVEQREDWFAWLPDEADERFRGAYGYGRGAHSMAESIGGEGKTFSFYTANLIRGLGSDWKSRWRENTVARLHDWGFNTIGNWSQWDVLQESDLPFVANLGIAGVRPIAAATGYWARMMDVYDPGFAPAVDEAVRRGTEPWRDNPRCIGYFVDNELAWEGIMDGVLKSGPDQPARRAFLAWLRGRYPVLDALNSAWGSAFTDWDSVAPPALRTDTFQADLDAFLYEFAATYFRTIKEAIDRHAPGQLYLGARFASAPEPAVRACAAHADVVSFNLYARDLRGRRANLMASLDKPVIIGEFHFGATDRGMFHTGLVPVDTQAERGAAYVHYVESLLRHPAVVGCHWFQYVDEPTTGRYYDGENYNIGMVDVTDRPYSELVGPAAALHRRMYRVRHSTN